MESSKDPISVRVARINSEITGSNSKVKKNSVLSRESLLDVLQVLFDECSLEALQKYDKNIAQFVDKYRSSVRDLKNVRVNMNDFEVKNIIGRGHFGEVHVVKERQTGDVYAMKTMRKFDNDIRRTSFEEERNIMAFSQSPWHTLLQYAFQDATHLYFIMEFHPGGDLLGLLYRQGGTLPETAAVFYLAELVLALEDLHVMGYVHRDVKPDNILLDRCGHLKLADFGSAAKLNRNGKVNSTLPVGTPDYIAPEILESLENKKDANSGYDASCDFWSLGILAYELTIGNTPFQGQNTTTVYTKIMNHANNLKFPPDLTLSQAYISFIKGLITSSKSRINQKQIKSHVLFKNTNFDTLRDQVPPFVPKISSTEDTSNFTDIQTKKKNPSIDNFKKRTQFSGRHLPFIGFTFTHDPDSFQENFKKKNKNDEIVESMQKEIEKYRKEVSKFINVEKEKAVLEKKLQEKDAKIQNLETLRDTLEKDLAGSLNESISLKRTLDLERKDWAELEKKALELIKGAKLKWAANEKQKVDTLNLLIEQLREKISELTNTNKLLDEQLQHALKVQGKHKQSLEKVQDMSRRSVVGLENQLEKVTVESRVTLQEVQKKLNEAVFEKTILENKISECIEKEHLLKEKLKNSKSDYEELKTKVYEGENLVKELSKKVLQLEKSVDTIEEYKKEINTLQNQINNNQKVIKDLENRNTMLQMETKTLVTYKNEIDTLNEKILKIQNDKKVTELESKLHESEEKINSLKKQIQDNDNNANSENQELREMRVKFWRMEKEFGNCKVDKRILERELKDAQNEISELKEKIKTISKTLEDSQKSHEIALLELSNINESISLEMVQTRENLKNLQDKFSNEKLKREEEKNMIVELKGRIKSKEDKIEALNREIESVKRAKNSLESQNKNCDFEKKTLISLVENLQKEKNDTLHEVERLRKEIENKELSLSALKEACTLLEEQVIEYEKINTSHLQKHNELTSNTEKLISDICKSKQEIVEIKKQLNEEKSLKLVAEAKIKRLEEDVKCLQKECASYKEKCVDYKQSLTDLSDTLTISEERYSNLEITIKSLERQLEEKTRENNALKEEISEHITQISKTQDSNHKLNRHIHDLKIIKEELTHRLVELERTLNEQMNYYKERDLKNDATIKQQIKLIDYLQSKIDEMSHKKKTLTEVIFGSSKKENKPPSSLALNYKDLESELVKERQNNRQLQEELFKLKAVNVADKNNFISSKIERQKSEILSPRSKDVVSNIVHSPNPKKNEMYRQNSKQRMQHNIPHRFDTKLCTNKSTKCAQCSNQIVLGRNMHICRECNVPSHPTCSKSLPSTCGLPKGFALHYKEKIDESETQRKETPQVSLENAEVKSWVKIPSKSSGWEKKYAVLTPNAIHIYTNVPDEDNSVLEESFLIEENNCTGKVILEPIESEIGVSVANSDLPFILKVEVAPETTCWPTKSMVLMTLSAKDKDMWCSALQKIFHTEELSPFETIFKIPEELSVNSLVDLTENIKILGTPKGLYSYYENNLNRIDGLDQIHQISVFPHANTVLMIANSKSNLISCDLNHLINLVQCGSKRTLKYGNVNVNGLCGFHVLEVSKVAKQSKIAVATSKQLIILEYDLDQNDFFTARVLDTAEPTGCMLFTENSLIVGADKFFEIDLSTYVAEEFLDLSDEKLRQVIKCYKIGSFPLGILLISKNPREYLVCFNEFSIFVDEYGRSSRKNELKSTHLPVGFHFIKQYLYVVQFSAIEVFKITDDSFNEENESTRLELDKFNCVGSNNKGIFLQQGKEIKFFDAKKHLDIDLSLVSENTEDVTDNGSDKFSFTSSMIQSLDGNQSDTENEDSKPRKVTFSNTNV